MVAGADTAVSDAAATRGMQTQPGMNSEIRVVAVAETVDWLARWATGKTHSHAKAVALRMDHIHSCEPGSASPGESGHIDVVDTHLQMAMREWEIAGRRKRVDSMVGAWAVRR